MGEEKNMTNVSVITDSVAGIPREMAKQYNITVVPAAHILYNGRNYTEGEDLSISEAYALIEKDPDRFVTSAISPAFLVNIYRDLSLKTDNILFITLSGALSAVSKTAQTAAEFFGQESPKTVIRVFDSKTCAGAQGLITLAAAKAAVKGMNLNEVTEIAQKVKDNMGYLAMLDTLRYVYRTGRMSKLASRMAALFSIKPISRVSKQGTLDYVTRTRNREDGMNKMIELIKQESNTKALHFWVMHADAPDIADQFIKKIKDNFDCLSMTNSEYSPVMGYGTGRKAISVGFHPELILPV